MIEALQEAVREGMTVTLPGDGTITVKGNWKTPAAQRLADVLRANKPLVMAQMRDLSAYVGETVAPDVWAALEGRAAALGWHYEASAAPEGWRICALHGRPFAELGADEYDDRWRQLLAVEEKTLDPGADYVIRADTGELVRHTVGRVPSIHFDGGA